MNIEQMPAGQEMDALIAEKIFGWRYLTAEEANIVRVFATQDRHWMVEPHAARFTFMLSPENGIRPPGEWSSRIDNAWVIVEKLKGQGYAVVVEAIGDGGWHAGFYRGDRLEHEVQGETAALAICRAALKIIGQ